MRRVATHLTALFVGAILLSGCANEGPTGEEFQEQLRRGVSGEGRLGTIDRSDDPYVKDREPAQLPPTP